LKFFVGGVIAVEKKLNVQVWAGIVGLIISGVFFYKSLEYPYMADNKPGSGFFPIWICGLMMLFSGMHIVQSLRNSIKAVELIPNGKKLVQMLIVFGSMICFIVAAPYLGFTLASTLFLMSLFCLSGYKWYRSLSMALAASILLFLLFHSFLGVAFPVNDLGW
jgi:energy-converting hydrogenase Eha subunit C